MSMSDKITLDAVPLTEARGPVKVDENSSLPSSRISNSRVDGFTTMNNNMQFPASDQSVSVIEPMRESSDSNDSTGSESSTTQIGNQVIIKNPTGLVHLGPTYNISVGQAFTQVNSNSVSNSGSQMNSGADEMNINVPPKEFLRSLYYSSRVIAEDELLRLSKNIGSNWKSVGNGLKFNWAQLDQFENDTNCLSDAVHRMLYRWLQWKDQKATIGRLTKVLFNHKEYEAIRCLSP